jgi:hypothetical protein
VQAPEALVVLVPAGPAALVGAAEAEGAASPRPA